MQRNEFREKSSDSPQARFTILLGLLGAYANAVAYPMVYGKGNNEFDLALLNWLRNPSLYPNDPITHAFARFPTIFWPLVASLSDGLSTEKLVFLSFLATKVLFFLALARLLARTLTDSRLATCIVLAVALSHSLNDFTPFGGSDILNDIQTHTSLAVALLLWAGIFLLEGRWFAATAIWALSVYINALFAAYALFAFAAFAVFDWTRQKREILVAPLLGVALALPWLLFSRGIAFEKFPKDYVETLLVFYPLHLNLHSHSPYDWISGAGLLVAAVLMAAVAKRARVQRDSRLEVLAAAFFVAVALGAVIGEFFLTPWLARLQLLRADSFLVLYAFVLVQIYGANLLLSRRGRGAATTFFLGTLAVLLPLSDVLGLVWPLLIALLLWAYPQEGFENLARRMASARWQRAFWLVLLLVGITLAGRTDTDWTATVIILLVILGGSFFVYPSRLVCSPMGPSRLSAVVCGIALAMLAVGTVPKVSMIWHPELPPASLDVDWRGVQLWAKSNTPIGAQFLVPIFPGGFRVFSERSSWGEWKDGQAAYHWPPFADIYRERMQAIGFPWRPEWIGTKTMMSNYKQLPWEHLLLVARANRLSYIIQFREVQYPSSPIYMNGTFAVYPVPQ